MRHCFWSLHYQLELQGSGLLTRGGGGEGGRSLWDYMLCRAIFLGHQWTDAIMRKDLIKEGPFLHLLATLPADSLALWALQGLLWPATDRILAQVSPA